MDARVEETSDQLMVRIKQEVNGQLFRGLGNRVLGGPFEGMVIPERNRFWDDGNSGTKLLGVYEHELIGAIEHAIWRRPKVLVNVGCAEGYYAIGLARAIPDLKAYAFDINTGCISVLREYAERNEVAYRVSSSEGCHSASDLNVEDYDRLHKLYIVDCEGAELQLIDPAWCQSLCHSDLIIECHDFLNPHTSSVLADRLGETHNISVVRPALPDFSKFSFIKRQPSLMSIISAVEMRPMPCCWLVCWAKTK